MVLYRQWRPRRFSEVVGQPAITRTLQNVLRAGRVGHAYLFSGPRGTGKTTVARLLARAVNCQAPTGPEPCNECPACRSALEGASPDVVEIDAASHRGIEEMRDLRERVRSAPVMSRYRVYVIDEAHMLTPEAFNALLKTLEEPPSHAIFILATTEPHKMPVTVLSRCQRFDFRRVPEADIRAALESAAAAEGAEVTPAAMAAMASRAEGSLRDALGLLEQCLAYAGSRLDLEQVHEVLGTVDGRFLERLAGGLRDGSARELLALVEEVVAGGKDVRQLVRDLMDYLRGQLVAAVEGGSDGGWRPAELIRQLQEIARAEADMRWSPHPRLVLEMALLRLTPTGAMEVAEEAVAPAPNPPAPESGRARQPAAVESEATGSSGIDWPRVLTAVHTRSVPLHTFLQKASPIEAGEGRLTLVFAADAEVQMKRVAAGSPGILEEVLAEVTGRGWEIGFEVAPLTGASRRRKRNEPSEPLVSQTLTLFEGEVVDDG
ncbi:MAG TPA: DNA polymerase III subunit gamma/tau [Bacillota bacterium]|nr:DNA polymerase III subunit gamma/tau [Bacillota bacterium]